MAPYFLVLGLVVTLATFPRLAGLSRRFERDFVHSDHSKRFSFAEVLAVFALVAFSAVRYGIGTDYPVYASLYRGLDTQDWGRSIAETPQEAGYTIFSLMTKSVFTDPQAIFWTTSFVTVIIATWVLKHSDGNFAFALFLYISLAYYLSPFNIVRQGMAVSILLLAAHVFDTSKPRFFVLVALAASIHISALVFGLGFLLTRRLKPSFWLLGTSLGLGVILAGSISASPGLAQFLEKINPRYDEYLDVAYEGMGLYLVLIFKVGLLAYVLLLPRGREVNRHYLVLAIFGLALTVVGTSFKYLGRVESFFGVFIVLAAAEAVSKSRNPAVHMLIIGAASVGYLALYLANYGGLVPYQTIWSAR